MALSLAALVLPFLLNLIPSGRLAQQKGENLQAATAFALEWIEDASLKPPKVDGTDKDQTVLLNGVAFHATREARQVEGQKDLQDVIVTLTTPRGEPIRLAIRLPRQ